MQSLLAQLVAGRSLDADQAAEAFEQIMTGQSTAAQTAALLALLQQRGATVEELIGAARVMRDKVTPVSTAPGLRVIDTCGTGGDHTPTFNISTAAAIVAAAVARPRGVAVAKHGNKTVTRTSGSSQGLEALGVKLMVKGETLTCCLDEAGLCFCFAPAHHPAMKHAMGVRQELGFRTIFNLLGPLTNPAGASAQIIGVCETALLEPLAQVLDRLGCHRALIVHGFKDDAQTSGFCELSISGPSRLSELQAGQITTRDFDARDLGIARCPIDALLVTDPAQSAAVIRGVLSGEAGPARDIVALNAAAALLVSDLADDMNTAFAQATEAIASGAAQQVLEKLVTITNAD